MIDVPELDLYIKTIYYWFNSNSEIYRNILSEELQSWISFFGRNAGIIDRFKRTVEKREFGFKFEIGRSNSMYGQREIRGLFDPNLLLPAPFLKIYSRLLYRYDFINESPEFDNHQYYFRYYPKMIVRVYLPSGNNNELVLRPASHWVMGAHTPVAEGGHLISYNVACDVDLKTIIEEELHAQIPDLHGTTTVAEVVQDIETNMPELKNEIESNLNRILSTEEKKFSELGNMLRIECASELRILENFVNQFEEEVMKSTEIHLPPDPTTIRVRRDAQ